MHTIFTAITFTTKDPKEVKKNLLENIDSIMDEVADRARLYGFDYLAPLDKEDKASEIAEDILRQTVELVHKNKTRPRDFPYSFLRGQYLNTPIAILYDDGCVNQVCPSWAEAMAYADLYMNTFSNDSSEQKPVPVAIYAWDCHF